MGKVQPAADRTSTRRPGFSLVEVVVALVLINIGLLALIAATATAIDQVGDLDRQRRATRMAQSRVESLAVQPCGGSSVGIASPETGMRETWSVGAAMGSVREVTDSIEFPGRVTNRVVIRTMAPC